MARLIRKKTKADTRRKSQSDDSSAPDSGVRQPGVQRPDDVNKPAAAAPVKREPLARKPLTHVKTPLESRKSNFIQVGLQFLREVRVEFKKVTWPSRKQTVGSTVVVLILVLIISAFLGVIDIGLSSLMDLIL